MIWCTKDYDKQLIDIKKEIADNKDFANIKFEQTKDTFCYINELIFKYQQELKEFKRKKAAGFDSYVITTLGFSEPSNHRLQATKESHKLDISGPDLTNLKNEARQWLIDINL